MPEASQNAELPRKPLDPKPNVFKPKRELWAWGHRLGFSGLLRIECRIEVPDSGLCAWIVDLSRGLCPKLFLPSQEPCSFLDL